MNRKNTISKLMLLLVISAIMINTMMSTTNAAFVADTGNITVNKIEKGVTLTFYKIVEENFSFRNQQPQDPPYLWAEEMVSWVKENYPEFINTDNKNAVTEEFSKADAAKIAEFYDKLSVAIKKGTVTPENESAESQEETFTASEMLIGSYLILIENGARIYRPLTANVVHEWKEEEKVWKIASPVVDAKSTIPSISKTVTEGQEKDHMKIGDTVHYELNATVPTYPDNAIAKTMVVSDILSQSLTLNNDSIKAYGVNAGAEPVLLEDAYTRTTSRPTNVEGNKTTTFSLNFKYEKIKAYTSVKVTYDAMLNKNANIGPEGNGNHAYLDYNNNPYIDGSWITDEDEATVYTYGLKILKVDEETEEPLSGAEFFLYKGEEEIRFVNESGTYRVSQGNEVSYAKMVSNEKGEILIQGLDAGEYELYEEDAPDGYIKLQHTIKVTVEDEDFDGKVECDGDEQEDGTLIITVKNGKGFTLPVTGGMGTLVFSTMGILMMGAGFILVLTFIRKKNETK